MKKVVKSNPILFELWYHLYRKNRGVKIGYFNSKTSFLLDGYPRSGNTFFAGLCKRIFNSDEFIHHFHAIAPIKIALNKRLPIFILLRELGEAISSYYLKSFALSNNKLPSTIDKKLLNSLIRDYFDYYTFVYHHKTSINILVFEEYILNAQGLLYIINDIVFNKKQYINHAIIEAYQGEYRGATDILGSSRPNAVKENLKFKIKEHLVISKYYKEYIDLYNKLSLHD